jgi:hypothetical protein
MRVLSAAVVAAAMLAVPPAHAAAPTLVAQCDQQKEYRYYAYAGWAYVTGTDTVTRLRLWCTIDNTYSHQYTKQDVPGPAVALAWYAYFTDNQEVTLCTDAIADYAGGSLSVHHCHLVELPAR